MKFEEGDIIQWGNDPDNLVFITEIDPDNGRYFVLVLAQNFAFPNGSPFNADHGDVITLGQRVLDMMGTVREDIDVEFIDRVLGIAEENVQAKNAVLRARFDQLVQEGRIMATYTGTPAEA